ncbi:MAG: 4Fe-4S binding protein [Oscillospiraceae bacterium]|nr:4Fe-4S binding protein [Oscillospiraceae bacterium]
MRHRYLKDVATLVLDADKCVGCERCVEVCPHGVFDMADHKARLAEKDFCMECGACAKNCPVSAISVDVGVGCAYAFIMGWLTGSEPSCDCSGGKDCC